LIQINPHRSFWAKPPGIAAVPAALFIYGSGNHACTHHLLENLAAEYVYAELCEAAMYAFEAENQARMIAMTSAKTNIETKLAGLVKREHLLRQEEITTEIIELAAGADAFKSK
jgi:F0F1-type ATP synthase gamma subunit